jgi:hypothetical protein
LRLQLGAVYIAENTECRFCEVGSSGDPRRRASELASLYGLEIRYLIGTEKHSQLEALFHKALGDNHRVEVTPPNGEFYDLSAFDVFETVCDVADANKIAMRPWQEAWTFGLKRGQKPNAPPYRLERVAYAPLDAFAIIAVEPSLGWDLVAKGELETIKVGSRRTLILATSMICAIARRKVAAS